MTLWDMLDKTKYYQRVLIYETNNRGQNMPIFCGTVDEARRDGDDTWDYLPCEVENYDCAGGILDIRVRTRSFDKPFEEQYFNSDEWGKEKNERPWRWDREIDEEKAEYLKQEKDNGS